MPATAPQVVPPCARCGHDARFDFDGLWLCLDCYHVAGSTCAGIARPGELGRAGADPQAGEPSTVC